ncbi:MAG: hypothetical protein U0744_19685 [Gemmataceae bacterium]
MSHWSQAGAIAFITWRTWDSLPQEVIERWQFERSEWLASHGIDPKLEDWRLKLQRLDDALQSEFAAMVSERWNDNLDACHGVCPLRNADLAQIVGNSLLHFDGDRYEVTDFVVMLTHVHLMAAFPNEEAMLGQCELWKRLTATRIKRFLRRSGRLWQQDGFDHLVLSQAQFDYLRRYLAENPKNARLRSGEYMHYSKSI